MILDDELEKRGFPPAYCGADCPDGWKDLVLDLLDKLKGKCKIAQIKEKFALLTVYVDPLDGPHEESFPSRFPFGTEEIEKLIDEAQEASAKICMVCGAPGNRGSDGWITVLCELHRQERIEERRKWQAIRNSKT